MVISVPSTAKADPTATTILLKAQDYTTDVSTITFPTGAPGATISNPSNDKPITPDTQIFGAAEVAHPVITLVNNASVQYTIWYNISAFTNSVVANEYYLINDKGAACANDTLISNAVTFGADTKTSTTIAATGGDTAKKDLYLKVTLGYAAVKTGTSTITILGEP